MASEAATGQHPLAAVLGLLRADAPATIMGAPEDWPRWAVLLPHVLAATSHLPAFRGPDIRGSTEAAWLLDRAATYLKVHARLDEARYLQERALTIIEATYGPDHPDVAAALNNLALILQDLGDPAAARPLLERALTIAETTYGPDHPIVATRLNNLAMILWRLGDPDAGRLLAERALAITEAAHGPDHPAVPVPTTGLALGNTPR